MRSLLLGGRLALSGRLKITFRLPDWRVRPRIRAKLPPVWRKIARVLAKLTPQRPLGPQSRIQFPQRCFDPPQNDFDPPQRTIETPQLAIFLHLQVSLNRSLGQRRVGLKPLQNAGSWLRCAGGCRAGKLSRARAGAARDRIRPRVVAPRHSYRHRCSSRHRLRFQATRCS